MNSSFKLFSGFPLVLLACSSSSSATLPADGGPGMDAAAPMDSSQSDTTTPGDTGGPDAQPLADAGADAAPEASTLDTGTPDTSVPDAGATFTLTINDYLNWCGITENGSAYSATKSFPNGTVVNLNGTALSGFVWGYWTGTDGDKSAAHDKNQMTTATMSSDKTVLACCPFPPPASQTCP